MVPNDDGEALDPQTVVLRVIRLKQEVWDRIEAEAAEAHITPDGYLDLAVRYYVNVVGHETRQMTLF